MPPTFKRWVVVTTSADCQRQIFMFNIFNAQFETIEYLGESMKTMLIGLSAVLLTVQISVAGSFAPIVKLCTESEGRALLATKSGGILWFSAPWCPTCARQNQSFDQLVADKSLEAPITVCKIDYDTSFPLQRNFNVFSQSALVKVAGGQMIKKSVGTTDTFSIKLFLEK